MGLYGDDRVLLATDDEHTIIAAPTRTGKTRRLLLPAIACLGLAGECMCIFDPKGELYGLTSEFLKDNGVKVNRIDFSDPAKSNRYNPLYRAIVAYMGEQVEEAVSEGNDNPVVPGGSDDGAKEKSSDEADEPEKEEAVKGLNQVGFSSKKSKKAFKERLLKFCRERGILTDGLVIVSSKEGMHAASATITVTASGGADVLTCDCNLKDPSTCKIRLTTDWAKLSVQDLLARSDNIREVMLNSQEDKVVHESAKSDLADLERELQHRLETAEKEVKLVVQYIFPRDRENEGNSSFFNDGAENLISMTLHYLCSHSACPTAAKSIFTACKLISEFCQPEKLTKSPGEDRIFSPLIEEVHKLNSRHPAYAAMSKIDGSKYLGDFISTASGKLTPYTSTSVAKMMCGTDMPLDKLADEPTATFIIVPNGEDTFKQTAQLYVNQLYTTLTQRASELGGRLPHRMNIIGEEFKQLPRFDNLDERLSLCAGWGIRWTIVLQSITQLQSAYSKEDAATIMENCGTKVVLRAGTAEMGKYVEDLCGDYTIATKGTSASKAPTGFTHTSVNESESLRGRKRILSAEAQRWNPDQGVMVLKAGCMPACSTLPRLENTPFNEILGLGDERHNQLKTEKARAVAAHDELIDLPSWSIELNKKSRVWENGELKTYTDEQRKALRSKYLTRLYHDSKRRQEKKDDEPEPEGKHAKKGSGGNKEMEMRAQQEPERKITGVI